MPTRNLATVNESVLILGIIRCHATIERALLNFDPVKVRVYVQSQEFENLKNSSQIIETKGHKKHIENSLKVVESRVSRELLEELAFDYTFLYSLKTDSTLRNSFQPPKNTRLSYLRKLEVHEQKSEVNPLKYQRQEQLNVAQLVEDAVLFIEHRAEFWRAKNPNRKSHVGQPSSIEVPKKTYAILPRIKVSV